MDISTSCRTGDLKSFSRDMAMMGYVSPYKEKYFVIACLFNQYEIAKHLAEHGVDVHTQNNRVLNWAVKNNQYNILNLIKEQDRLNTLLAI
jgi:hypothetical protein